LTARYIEKLCQIHGKSIVRGQVSAGRRPAGLSPAIGATPAVGATAAGVQGPEISLATSQGL
jgi:hypothetical protein